MSLIPVRNFGRYSTDLTRTVRRADNCRFAENAGTRSAELELLIDYEKLLGLMRHRALRSGRKQSRLAGGAIVLRAVKGTVIDVHAPHQHEEHCFRNGVAVCGCDEGSKTR